jgi:hypothetical protein
MKEKIKKVIYEWRYEIIGYSIVAVALIMNIVVVWKLFPIMSLIVSAMAG